MKYTKKSIIQKPPLPDDELFKSLWTAERLVGHEPTFNEHRAHGICSNQHLRRRFGKWTETLAHYRAWKFSHPNLVDELNQSPGISTAMPKTGAQYQGSSICEALAAIHPDRPISLHGEPILFRGLRHAPINEQGVVLLFGMVCRELGFSVESMQQGFPVCEGKYLYDKNKELWGKARIEFEFKASHFADHGHDVHACDFIVCWENDWPDCPITVVELRREIEKLPAQ